MTPLRRYFKLPTFETGHGAKGWWYVEFEGEWATRQIEVFPNKILTSARDGYLCDLPLKDTSLLEIPGAEITQEEFLAIWATYAG